VGENLLNKFTSSSRQVRSSIKYFFKKINLDRNGTFNSMGVIFNIFEGFNSPFNRRRASKALFCKEHTYGIIYSVHHYHCWETIYKDEIYKKKKKLTSWAENIITITIVLPHRFLGQKALEEMLHITLLCDM
jgi:hypothetical protein